MEEYIQVSLFRRGGQRQVTGGGGGRVKGKIALLPHTLDCLIGMTFAYCSLLFLPLCIAVVVIPPFYVSLLVRHNQCFYLHKLTALFTCPRFLIPEMF